MLDAVSKIIQDMPDYLIIIIMIVLQMNIQTQIDHAHSNSANIVIPFLQEKIPAYFPLFIFSSSETKPYARSVTDRGGTAWVLSHVQLQIGQKTEVGS